MQLGYSLKVFSNFKVITCLPSTRWTFLLTCDELTRACSQRTEVSLNTPKLLTSFPSSTWNLYKHCEASAWEALSAYKHCEALSTAIPDAAIACSTATFEGSFGPHRIVVLIQFHVQFPTGSSKILLGQVDMQPATHPDSFSEWFVVAQEASRLALKPLQAHMKPLQAWLSTTWTPHNVKLYCSLERASRGCVIKGPQLWLPSYSMFQSTKMIEKMPINVSMLIFNPMQIYQQTQDWDLEVIHAK